MAKYQVKITRDISAQQTRVIYIQADSHEQATNMLNDMDLENEEENYPGTEWKTDSESIEAVSEPEVNGQLERYRP